MIIGQLESSMCCLKEKQQRVGLCVEQLLCCLQHSVVVALSAASLQSCHSLLCYVVMTCSDNW